MPGNIDIGKLQENPVVHDAFSRLVSGGKAGYKTTLLKDKPQIKCNNCSFILEGTEKFCPECGAKLKQEKEGKETQ